MDRSFEATISGLYLNTQARPRTREERRVSPRGAYLVSMPVESVTVTLEGFAGDRHAGLTRRADARVPFYPRGAEIRNSRQVSLVAEEELAELAAALGVPTIDPTWLGANLLTRGIPRLSHLPPGTRLFFPRKAVIVVAEQNQPCGLPGAVLARQYPDAPKLAGRFVTAACGLRGVVGWVERAGTVATGDLLKVELPPAAAYSYPSA